MITAEDLKKAYSLDEYSLMLKDIFISKDDTFTYRFLLKTDSGFVYPYALVVECGKRSKK